MELSCEGCVQPTHSSDTGELGEAQLCMRQLWSRFARCKRAIFHRPWRSSPSTALLWMSPLARACWTGQPALVHWAACALGRKGCWNTDAVCQHLTLLEHVQMLWKHCLCWKSSKILWACGTGSGLLLCFQMTSLMGRHTVIGSCAILMQASQEQNFGHGGCKRVVIGMD